MGNAHQEKDHENDYTSAGEIVRSTRLRPIIGMSIIPLLFGGSLQCAAVETASITLATDKTRYVKGETIKLVTTNNLDIPVWYIGYPQRDLVFWAIEKAQDNGWRSVAFRLPLVEKGREVCRMVMYERPVGVAMDLKPHSDLLYEWRRKLCLLKTVTGSAEPEMIERGRYRFVVRYSLETVKSENIENEPWKRPVDLGEIKVVYSNEFVVE